MATTSTHYSSGSNMPDGSGRPSRFGDAGVDLRNDLLGGVEQALHPGGHGVGEVGGVAAFDGPWVEGVEMSVANAAWSSGGSIECNTMRS